jgi:2-polyprenyl-6-methoxyphenol hydroxylase-like FAD-dependent oxidoreductase
VARPHVGAGVTKALEDAMALVQVIGGDEPVPQALRRYDMSRRPIGQRIVERARQLGAYMQAERTTTAEQRNARLFRQPDVVLAESASLHFLAPGEVEPESALTNAAAP